MKKMLNIYYKNEEAAFASVSRISQAIYQGSEICFKAVPSDTAPAFKKGILFTFLGGATGSVIALFLSFFLSPGVFETVLPVSGLLFGVVIGAVTGSLADIKYEEIFPLCTEVTICPNLKDYSWLCRTLKSCGGKGAFLCYK